MSGRTRNMAADAAHLAGLGAGPSGSASGHRAHRRLRAEQGRAASGALDGRAPCLGARVQEISMRAAQRAEFSLEPPLRELAAIAFSDITKAVTWGPSAQVRGERARAANALRLSPAGFRWSCATRSARTRLPRSQRCRRARRARSAYEA